KRLFRKAPPPEPVRGLYLWGGVGRGKSMLMDFFMEHTGIEGKRRVHFHAFMQEVHAGLHAARADGADDALRPVAAQMADGLRLLCLDEMQITDITDAMIVGRLFELLFAAGVSVVTTSNRVPDDLYKDGLQRDRFLPFIALIKDRLEVMHLASPTDYRQNRLSGADIYFTPADRLAREAMAAIWADFTEGAGAPLILQVQGRDVEIPQFHNGVGRATFWDFCAKPLGPADYLAIAQAVRVLLLEDIPMLSSENYNEARRFVTLIDALYEARVRLIASAAAAPEMLYLEGAGVFEFERTASRLREMQATDWGRS
ncbi:cell division protein ZapE, partial [Rhodovulum adriaticum]